MALSRSSRSSAACPMGAGLPQKPRPRVMPGICRRGHGYTEDRVASSGAHVMSQAATLRYEWNATPWRKLERVVYKLQKRIYRASERGDVKQVHRLQRLLLASKAAKYLAVRRVTQDNRGKKTAGVDGKTALTPQARTALVATLTLATPPPTDATGLDTETRQTRKTSPGYSRDRGPSTTSARQTGPGTGMGGQV